MYYNQNLPTQIQNCYWIYERAPNKTMKERQGDEQLANAIVSMTTTIRDDKTGIILNIDGKCEEITLSIENVDALAQKSGLLIGKWLLYRDRSEIDETWKVIANATLHGNLGISAKASTAKQTSNRHVICVYTDNYLDIKDVMTVRDKLRLLGYPEKLCYKPDIYTYLGIYSRTTILSPCRYRK
jgi:hypothetical protein